MKKNFLLTLLLTLCTSFQCWADFNPTAGKMYALKEVVSGLYLDIQTLGVKEANANFMTNNISLNVNPCVIYFEASNGKWNIKNANGTYAAQADNRNWNAVISENAYEWTIQEPSAGKFAIHRADNKFVGADNRVAGTPLFCNMEQENQKFLFSLVEYTYTGLNPQGYYTLKYGEHYANFNEGVIGDTKAVLQKSPTHFFVYPSTSANYLVFQNKDNAQQYLGYPTSHWSTTFDCCLWDISEPDDNGLLRISRHTGVGVDGGKHFGTRATSAENVGLYTNVPEGNCNKWALEGTFELSTQGTEKGGNYEFTSEVIRYYNPCNKLRFTLTESGAFFSNGAKRLSLDEFVLYDAEGKKVELSVSHFSGNNGKTYEGMLDGVNEKFAGTTTWNDGKEDDWFEILLPNDINLGGAFSFSFVTENTTMNAKAFKIETLFEKTPDYKFAISAPEDENIKVYYNGTEISANDIFDISSFNADLVTATDVSGYVWKITIDEANRTITLVYKQIAIIENPVAVVALANRIGGICLADKFKFVHDPSLNSKQEVFILGAEDGQILIKGTTISAITTGLGWYLNHIAKVNIAWNSLNEKTVEVKENNASYVDFTNISLPLPEEEIHVCDAKYRYYLNTCTFGYSMTSWTWTRWQQEIDWMALHGINMPLQLVGLEEVWRKFLTLEEGGKRKYGYSDSEAKAFVAGPAFIAWWAMNNLEGWGGTTSGSKSGGTWEGAGGVQDDAWYIRQKHLAQNIVTRQRELGMHPVLPGWSGMVPTNFQSKSGYTTRGNGGKWAGDFVRPLLLNVSIGANKYAEIAADYYACLKEVMGESQYYSMDPFHEGGGAGTMEDYKALYDAMEAAKNGSQWVIQQWQWSPTQKYSLTAVPAGRLVVLDLFSDGSPAFDGYNGYVPQEAVFCAIPNFGGRSGLMGRLNNLTDNYFKFKGKYASIKGIGAAPEAIEQTPVTYDLIFQLPWMNGVKPDVKEWVAKYAIARYGQDNEDVKAAWELLRQGPLNYGADGIQGPVEDVWAARPNLNANPASTWGKTINQAGGTYTKERRQMLIDATYKLLNQKDALNLTEGSVYESNYNYDLVEFGGGVIADYAYALLKGINTAKNAEGTDGETYKTRRDAFLTLIADVDKFKGTNLNFRLGKWTQEARDAAQEVNGATTATPDWYEYNNARTIVSTWSSPGTNLNDYSYRSWQGLMKDLYLPRWKYYFDNNCNNGEYKFFEWNWAHGKTHAVGQTEVSTTPLTKGDAGYTDSYTREPDGCTVNEAWNLLNKYIIPIKVNQNSTTYAYRHLDNDYSANVTIDVQTGTTDFTLIFGGNLEDATLTCNDLKINTSNLQNIVISGQEGSYPATLTFADKTIIKFQIKIKGTVDLAKDDLSKLTSEMEKLIALCGAISFTPTEIQLQTNDAKGTFYLSTNAPEPKEGDIAHLIDADMTTFFHSAWDKAVGGEHFLMVDAGIDNELKYLSFSYQANRGPFPYTINVSASNDNKDYTLLDTFDKDDIENPLPNSKDIRWTSSPIIAKSPYRFFRFSVTKSGGDGKNATPKGEYCFVMSDFDLTICTPEVTLHSNTGVVTTQQLLDAFEANNEAKFIVNNSTDLSAVRTAIEKLQILYDALLQAYNSTSTEINEIEFNGFNQPTTIYDLSGRTINAITKKGIYIQNDKKIYVK